MSNDFSGIGVVHCPGVAGTFTRHSPGVMVVNTAPAERLQSSQVANATSIGSGVEVASDDGWQAGMVACIEIGESYDLPFTRCLGIEAPCQRCADEKQFP